jgi:NAD(P)H-dependent flavin oxidoreductase YrpB (nitropropane dioxygenase family)
MGVRVSGSRLASAVSNTGALGVIASVGLGEDDSDAGFPIRSAPPMA